MHAPGSSLVTAFAPLIISSSFFNIFYLHFAIKKDKLLYSRGKKVQNCEERKPKPKDYKVNYICTYIPQQKKGKKYKATFNNPVTA